DQYLTNGKSRSIPIIIFINEDGEEVTHWGPRSEAVQKEVDSIMDALPDKEDPAYKDRFTRKSSMLTARCATEAELWQSAYQSIKQKLEMYIWGNALPGAWELLPEGRLNVYTDVTGR